MHHQRTILCGPALAIVWLAGCADPCVDDGLSQGGQSGCPMFTGSGDTTDGEPDTTTSADGTGSGGSGCDNGIQDGDETDVDCGGSCQDKCGTGQGCGGSDDCTSEECGEGMTCEEPPTCTNGIQDGDETDVDCGGSCPPCNDGDGCNDGGDCQSSMCEKDICVDPGCRDGMQNGDETDVDCGGPTVAPAMTATIARSTTIAPRDCVTP